MTTRELWVAFMRACDCTYSLARSLPIPIGDRVDNPFIVQYAVYHHYRALGWVVKNGIKFCVDYLLYRRGPVFSHAEYVDIIFLVKADDIYGTQIRHCCHPCL